MSDVVINAREAFAKRAAAPVKFPAFSPNMRHLRDLCSGVCRTVTGMQPVEDFRDGVPEDVVIEVASALDRNVHSLNDGVVMQVVREGWLVVFDTNDDGSTFTFSFVIHRKWIGEKQPLSGA